MNTELQLATTIGEIECKEESGSLVVYGWASAPVVDRSNEYIDGRWFDLSEYNANPVYLWCHNRQSKPLGIAKVSTRQYATNYATDMPHGLFGEFNHDPNDEFAVKVYRAYQGGYMRGFSVGFKPIKAEYMTPQEATMVGSPNSTILKHLNAKLYEISAVPIPDNQAALSVGIVKELMGAMPDAMRVKVLAQVPSKHTFSVSFPQLVSKSPEPKEVSIMASETTTVEKAVEAEAKVEQPAVETPAVEKAEEVVEKEMAETSATATDDGKHGPKAFQHVISNCMKACQEGRDIVAKSDHPKAGKGYGAVCKKILKACQGAAKKGGMMWDTEEDKKFGGMMEEIAKSLGEYGEGEDEEDDDMPKNEPEVKPEMKSDNSELLTKEVAATLFDSLETLAERTGEAEKKVSELADNVKSQLEVNTEKLNGIESAVRTLLEVYSSERGIKI
jgi:HK97 family phage prohead protease